MSRWNVKLVKTASEQKHNSDEVNILEHDAESAHDKATKEIEAHQLETNGGGG